MRCGTQDWKWIRSGRTRFYKATTGKPHLNQQLGLTCHVHSLLLTINAHQGLSCVRARCASKISSSSQFTAATLPVCAVWIAGARLENTTGLRGLTRLHAQTRITARTTLSHTSVECKSSSCHLFSSLCKSSFPRPEQSCVAFWLPRPASHKRPRSSNIPVRQAPGQAAFVSLLKHLRPISA